MEWAASKDMAISQAFLVRNVYLVDQPKKGLVR